MNGVTEFGLRFTTCLSDEQVRELEGNTSCQPPPGSIDWGTTTVRDCETHLN